jgi:beta-glucosidase
MAYWPGMHGGEASADVLFGDHNPGGKLPFTYPRAPNALLTYDHAHVETLDGSGRPRGFTPQWEFGAGLSYTTFAYSNLRLGEKEIGPGGRLSVSVTVTNTGKRAGDEAVLLFARQRFATVRPPVRRLRAFQKVSLRPGEAKTIRFDLSADDLRYVGRDGRWVLEPGTFDVMVGGLTASFEVTTAAPARTSAAGAVSPARRR